MIGDNGRLGLRPGTRPDKFFAPEIRTSPYKRDANALQVP